MLWVVVANYDWWVFQGSNLGPSVYKTLALPTELNTPAKRTNIAIVGKHKSAKIATKRKYQILGKKARI